MGAADVIPGVSGGTIAFITGIYEELIESIRSINLKALRLLGTFQLKEFWKHINGNFLISVVAGIAISIFSLAKLLARNPPVIHLVLFLWSHRYFCPHGVKRNKKMGYTNHHLVNRWCHHRVHDHSTHPDQYSG